MDKIKLKDIILKTLEKEGGAAGAMPPGMPPGGMGGMGGMM